MKSLNVPTLQHLARNWHESPKKVESAFLQLAKSKPPFNYNSLTHLVRDHLVYGISEEQMKEGVCRVEKREVFRRSLIEIIPHFVDHFKEMHPDHVHEISPRNYSLGRGLNVPFRPLLIFIVGGQVYFPWFSFWKLNPLDNERLALFATLVHEMLSQDPDLEDARFQIFDFSARSQKESRQLRIIEGSDIPLVTESRKQEMLSIFVQGFLSAQEILNKTQEADNRTRSEVVVDINQLHLLD